MFFLLYVPMTPGDAPMSEQAIDRLAEQFAEQLLQQAARQQDGAAHSVDTSEVPAQLRAELRAQLVGMMQNMQKERLGADDEDESEDADEAGTQSIELIQTRDFLERCFKKSA